MPKKEIKNDVQPIKAYSFMVEVIERPNSSKTFIARVQGSTGPMVACMGTIKDFNQFIDSL